MNVRVLIKKVKKQLLKSIQKNKMVQRIRRPTDSIVASRK